MKMNKQILAGWLMCALAAGAWSGCSSEKISEGVENPSGSEDGGEKRGDSPEEGETPEQTGYAHPDGVWVLNCGARAIENGSLTYIAPDGTVEEDVYKKVNGTELGNEAKDMYVYGGKIYILCNDYLHPGGKRGDGALIIADAVTLKKEKCFRLEDLVFEEPEGMRPEYEPHLMSLSNIVVLDERNVFIKDAQALYRFDSTTGKLTLVKGSYHIANGGGTIEPLVGSKGMAVVNGRLYVGVGGFWTDDGLFEFVKDKDEVNRKLLFETGNLIAGVTASGDGHVWVATYNRSNAKKNMVYKINVNQEGDKLLVADERPLREDISPGYDNTSGISVSGDRIYYSGQTTTLQRFAFNGGSAPERLVDVAEVDAKAQYLTCNMVVNPKNEYVYISTSNTLMEDERAENSVFVYDCSGSEPVLKQHIVNQTDYASGVFFMSRFYNR